MSLPQLPSLNPTIMNKQIAAKLAASLPLKPIIEITPPDVKIVPIPGRGYGLIVTRNFKAGELVLAEHPLILANHHLNQSLEDSIRHALYTASSEALAKFYRLHNPSTLWSYWDDSHTGVFLTLEENIWNSNCLKFHDGTSPGNPMSGIFEIGSRINHSCLCNAEWGWNRKDLLMELYTLDNLQAGDEVLIDYLGLPAWEMTAKERRREISRDYNFLCRCKACDNELVYWGVKEKEERVTLRRFSHREKSCHCDMCDHRGPEDYHWGESLDSEDDDSPLIEDILPEGYEWCCY